MRSQEFVTVLVRDPRIHKEDSWHSHIDYEIFIHVSINSTVKALCGIDMTFIAACILFDIMIGVLSRHFLRGMLHRIQSCSCIVWQALFFAPH